MESNIDNIKILPETIRKNGYTYVLLRRTIKKALYAQYYRNVLIAFETFRIRVQQSRFSILLNASQPSCERFPGNEDFGRTAWTITEYQKAVEKYNEL